MIGIEIGLNRLARVGVALPQLALISPLALSWSTAGGGTVTITPPVTSPVFAGITYTATVDGVAATVTGLTFPAPQGTTPMDVQVTAIMSLPDYAQAASTAQFTLPALVNEILITPAGAYFTGNQTEIQTVPSGAAAWWQIAA